MKKFLMAIFALAVASSIATAGVGIQWGTLYGAYTHDAPNTTDYPSANNLLGSYSAIWQLIYAGANDAIDPIPSGTVPTAGGANGDYVYGDDVVWGQREIAQGGGSANDAPYNTTWDDWMANTGGSTVYENLTASTPWNTAGFVYQRVFETVNFGIVANNDYYYESSLFAFPGTYSGGGQPTQDFFIDTGSAGFQPDIQITAIPEPATMGLLGLGALVMAIRRRRS